MRTPRISVVIPTFNRPAELLTCLEGFAQQTSAAEEFEVVVVDDGSAEDLEKIAAHFRDSFPLHVERCDHAGVSTARNLAITLARAPLLLLYDDDLRPLPELIASCLRFHEQHTAIHEAELLHFAPDPEIAEMAVVRWAFERLYPFPATAGIYPWGYFWGGATTCKRSLFAELAFDPVYPAVEDAEFAFRASVRRPLAIHYASRTNGHFHRRLSVVQVCHREYRMAYFRCRMASQHGTRFSHLVYERPGDFIIGDWDAYRTMLSGLCPQETAPVPASSAKFQLLCGLWQKAALHATACGWLAAQTGGTPEASLFD